MEREIGNTENLPEELRNGIILAHLARKFQPLAVKKIFESSTALQFRHSDNINYFFAALRNEGLPDVFIFELIDLYEKKNIPKVIYCIHAYSYLLAKKGLAPNIKNLVGKLKFSKQALGDAADGLGDSDLPDFGNLKSELEKELDPKFIAACKIQAVYRGYRKRKAFRETMHRFKSNEKLFEKVPF